VKTIALASHNPVKAQATLTGFQRMFPAEQFLLTMTVADSGVRSQPLSSAETLKGAGNRARAALQAQPEADFGVGIEGGVEPHGAELSAFAWVVVLSPTGMEGKGRTGTFFLPPAVAELIRQGKELGEADDIVFAQSNSKQKNGAIGILTGDVIDRAALYEPAVIMALVPFKNPDLYR
jgi:inosine/xanthosine triphosphatase